MIGELSAFVIHRPKGLVANAIYVARHCQEKSSRFSDLFDDYPNRIDTTMSLPFKCKGNTFFQCTK